MKRVNFNVVGCNAANQYFVDIFLKKLPLIIQQETYKYTTNASL